MLARLHHVFPQKKALFQAEVRAGGNRRLESRAPEEPLSRLVRSRHFDHESMVAGFCGIRLQSRQHSSSDASVWHSTIYADELSDIEIEAPVRPTTNSLTLHGSSNKETPSGGAYFTLREA